MDRLRAHLDAVAAHLAAAALEAGLPLRHCAVHAGRFGAADEITRMAPQCPAVLVASLGVRELRRGELGELDAVADLAAYLLATDAPRAPRAEQLARLVELALVAVATQAFSPRASCGGLDYPASIRADNLWAGETRERGLGVWGVAWRQRIRIKDPDLAEPLITDG
ncbi:hypothetical protein [Megalodesulfovibrio paquesii]